MPRHGEGSAPAPRRGDAFSAREASLLEEAHRAGTPLLCPTCRSRLDATAVQPEESVSYVRRRLLVACPRCHRHGALDVPRSAW